MYSGKLRILCIAFCCFTVLCAGAMAAEQAPPMPHVFYGTAFFEDQPVPSGVLIEARGTGVLENSEGNPIAVGAEGTYGGQGTFVPKLIVQGNISTGTPIEFFINGSRAQCFDVVANSGWIMSYPFKPAGITQLNLRVSSLPASNTTIVPTAIPSPTIYYSGGGGGGGGGSYSGSSSSGITGTTPLYTVISTPVNPNLPTYSTPKTTTPATPIQKTQVQTTTTTVMVTTAAPPQTGDGFPTMMQLAIGGVGILVIVTIGIVYVIRKKNL
jgi:hypothetical protein